MYEHQEDIDIDREVSLLDLDAAMRSAVYRVADNVARSKKTDKEPLRLIADILRSFLHTHDSMRLILSKKDQNIKLAPDAASLVREQVEKVFVVTLFVEDPKKWAKVHGRDGWLRVYEYFLLEKQECGKLPERREFFDVIGPQQMEDGRRLFGITDKEKEVVEFKLEHPGTALPPDLQGHKIERFPIPGRAVREVKSAKRGFLQRWHREYVKLCGYSHIGYPKLALSVMDGREASFSQDQIMEYFEKEILLLATLSYIAAAAACTEAWELTGDLDVEALAKLTGYWESLRELSLLGRVFWDLHAKRQLAPFSVAT